MKSGLAKSEPQRYGKNGKQTVLYGGGSEGDIESLISDELLAEATSDGAVWTHVEVANQKAMEDWIEAKNQWLHATWTPNQSSLPQEEREELRRMAHEAQETMQRLAIRVW